MGALIAIAITFGFLLIVFEVVFYGVFGSYRGEKFRLRYLAELTHNDVALDHGDTIRYRASPNIFYIWKRNHPLCKYIIKMQDEQGDFESGQVLRFSKLHYLIENKFRQARVENSYHQYTEIISPDSK